MLRVEMIKCRKCGKVFKRTSGGIRGPMFSYEIDPICPDCASEERKEDFHNLLEKIKNIFE